MSDIIALTHRISVTLFFLIYVIKTILLLSNKQDLLIKLTKITKVPEMIVSALFLITGVYLMTQLPEIKSITWIKVGLVIVSIPVAIVGFKNGNKILAALALLLITASYGLGEVAKKKREKGEIVSANIVSGSEIYSSKCASCHGSDGKAGLSGATDLSKSLMEVNAMKQIIISGKGNMLAIGITEEQAAAVAGYVETEIKGK